MIPDPAGLSAICCAGLPVRRVALPAGRPPGDLAAFSALALPLGGAGASCRSCGSAAGWLSVPVILWPLSAVRLHGRGFACSPFVPSLGWSARGLPSGFCPSLSALDPSGRLSPSPSVPAKPVRRIGPARNPCRLSPSLCHALGLALPSSISCGALCGPGRAQRDPARGICKGGFLAAGDSLRGAAASVTIWRR